MIKNDKFKNLGGGATLLTARSADFGGLSDKINQFDKQIKLNYNFNMRNYSLNKEMINNKTVSEAHRNRKPHSIHFTHSTYAKSAAFTLAEVLITLGIIGVVAAMTIPTLIANYQEKQTVSRLQKAYSTLKNAFELAKVEHGDYNTWSWNQVPVTNAQRVQYFWETYIFSNLKVTEKCFPIEDGCLDYDKYTMNGSVFANGAVNSAFMLSDGTAVYTWAGGNAYHPHIWIFADINGVSKPNTVGRDIFAMHFSPNDPGNKIGSLDDDGNFVDSGNEMKMGYGLSLYGEVGGVSVDDLLDPNFVVKSDVGANNKIGCSTESLGYVCAAAIKLNGWKIPDNYP